MSEEHGRITTQGLEVYAEFVDDHGTPVKVKDSGVASPRVWLLTKNAHLDVDQARLVRDALDRFIAKHTGPDPQPLPLVHRSTRTASPVPTK